ncbi:hypothetical protein [Clostridium perfringens]|uniref:hypothetical protein n=1 Tax=Clostridium perfringens TaxID=1502 RepID=UPI0023F6E7FC|nr:hypothetical protein [Clostridium perfringens]WEV20068.1 hypothetical protein PL323_05395 [Clostridium perfringens D]
MEKFKKIGLLKFLAVLFLIVVVILSLIYLGVSLFYLLPFGISFFRGTYITSNDLMPNYSTVFESIFTLINILTSLLVSFLLYKLTQKQSIDSYNKEIAGPSNLVYFKIKYYLIHCLIEELRNNSENIISESFSTKNGIKQSNSVIYRNLPQVNIDNLEDNIYKILGEIKDDKSVNKLLIVSEDIRRNALLSMLKPGLIDLSNHTVIETRGGEWGKIIYGLYYDDLDCLTNDHKKMMKDILELSKRRK